MTAEEPCSLTDVISNHGINVRHNDYEYEDADGGLAYFNTNSHHSPQESIKFLEDIEERWRNEEK